MRSDASFKKISFPLDKPLVGDSSLARHVAKFNQKEEKKKRKDTLFVGCSWHSRTVYAGHREKNQKNTESLLLIFGHPSSSRKALRNNSKKKEKQKVFVVCVFPGTGKERKKNDQKNERKNRAFNIRFCAAVPNHRSWSPRSDVAGFMDVMQTKGSRQISRVPSEDAVAPTSGDDVHEWVCVCFVFCPGETQGKRKKAERRRNASSRFCPKVFVEKVICWKQQKISLRLELLCLRGRIRLFNWNPASCEVGPNVGWVREVTSAQCSECQCKEISPSAGKRRE